MSSEKTEDKSLTFVQITDAHLFDSGKRENPGTERIDTRLAWDWALLQINQMVLSGRRIDFVVFTGDFGLENLKDCAALQKGAELVADDLANLLVKKVLLVRGNNDLTDEDPEDAGRFDAFVGFLSGHIQKFKNEEKAKPPREERIKLDEIVNLTPAPTMAAPKPASLWCIAGTGPQYSDWGNIRFLGLDSSSFKNSKIKDCRRTLTPERYDRQLAEFQRVEQIVNKDGKLSVLLPMCLISTIRFSPRIVRKIPHPGN